MPNVHYEGLTLMRNNAYPINRVQVGWLGPSSHTMSSTTLDKVKGTLRQGKNKPILDYHGVCENALNHISRLVEDRNIRDEHLGVQWHVGYVKAHRSRHNINVNLFRDKQVAPIRSIDVVLVRTVVQGNAAVAETAQPKNPVSTDAVVPVPDTPPVPGPQVVAVRNGNNQPNNNPPAPAPVTTGATGMAAQQGRVTFNERERGRMLAIEMQFGDQSRHFEGFARVLPWADVPPHHTHGLAYTAETFYTWGTRG